MLVLVAGVIFIFASLINSTGFRDPTKKDLVKITSIDKDRLTNYPFVTIIIRNFSRMTYGRSTSKMTEKMKVYSVVLLNPTHRSRIKIGGFYSKVEANKMLLEISEKYAKKIVNYNPQVTNKTRNRR